MRPISRHAFGFPIARGILLVAVASGCADAESDPLALLIAEETSPSLQFSPPVPALPSIVAAYGVEEATSTAVGLWEESWFLPEADAQEMRREAYHLAAPVLVEAMGVEIIEATLLRLSKSLESAAWLGETLPVTLFASLGAAAGLVEQGLQEQAEGHIEAAIVYGLEAADALQGVTPEFVAEYLIRRAYEGLGRFQVSDSYTEQTRQRARRLVFGAREALEDSDLPRAIRRAYYACQIMGVELR
jgi:hypothetical protein